MFNKILFYRKPKETAQAEFETRRLNNEERVIHINLDQKINLSQKFMGLFPQNEAKGLTSAPPQIVLIFDCKYLEKSAHNSKESNFNLMAKFIATDIRPKLEGYFRIKFGNEKPEDAIRRVVNESIKHNGKYNIPLKALAVKRGDGREIKLSFDPQEASNSQSYAKYRL